MQSLSCHHRVYLKDTLLKTLSLLLVKTKIPQTVTTLSGNFPALF